MANLLNYRNQHQTNYLVGIGQKVKHLAQIGMELKGLYEAGRTLYAVGQAAAPYVLPVLGVL
jgi:hypothetical protein